MTGFNGRHRASIDKRDFDTNRPLLDGHGDGIDGVERDNQLSRPGTSLSDGEDGLLNNVVDEIVERDRRKMAKEVVRISSFALGVISW